jgi:purine-binding chemotaxis protein CheW
VHSSETQLASTVHGGSAAKPGSVWERLRESLERFGSASQQASDPAALAAKLAHRAKLLRSRQSTTPEQASTAYLAFNSGRERFGVPVNDVVEILALDHYSPVPRTPPFVVGVIQWRGAILTVLDLGRLLDIPESGLADYHVCIIVEAAGTRVALVAREVEEIFSIPLDQIKPVPEQPGHASPEWVTGVHDGTRLLLSPELIIKDKKFVN